MSVHTKSRVFTVTFRHRDEDYQFTNQVVADDEWAVFEWARKERPHGEIEQVSYKYLAADLRDTK